MKQQPRLGSRYADFRDGLSQSILPDRLGKRAAANLTEGGSPLGGRGALSVRHFAGNRWMMIAERPQSSDGTVVQFLDLTAMKIAEQRRQSGTTAPHGPPHLPDTGGPHHG